MKHSVKKIGVWLDHTKALIIEINNNPITSYTIESLSAQVEKQNFGKDESLKNNTEHNQLADFYKKIIEVIKDYSEVLLFGPTDAKTVLFNKLKKESHFNKIIIDTETTDYLSENQMNSIVKEHFEKKSENKKSEKHL